MDVQYQRMPNSLLRNFASVRTDMWPTCSKKVETCCRVNLSG